MANNIPLVMMSKTENMKYVLFIISLILTVYPMYSVIKCLQVINDLSNYGAGVLVGSLLMLSVGILLMYVTLTLITKKKSLQCKKQPITITGKEDRV